MDLSKYAKNLTETEKEYGYFVVNTRLLKALSPDTKLVNVHGAYAYYGDRLLWDSIRCCNLRYALELRRSHMEEGRRRNLRWTARLATDADLERIKPNDFYFPKKGDRGYVH